MAELKKPEEIHQNQDVISKSDPAQNEVETEKSSQEQEVKAEEATSVSDDQLPVASSSSATAGESASPQTSPEPPSSPEISPETVPSSPEIAPLDLKTIAASITSVAGAHATQVNASPEDMEFNRLRSTYTNNQGEYVLDKVASQASEALIASMRHVNTITTRAYR